MTFGDTIPASSFMRQAAGPTFYVKQGLSGRRDVVPPSRVIDFHVSQIVNDSLYVALEWTAPGNNYDQGKGMKYILLFNICILVYFIRCLVKLIRGNVYARI